MNTKYYRITVISPDNIELESYTIFQDDFPILIDFMKEYLKRFCGQIKIKIDCLEMTE